MASKKNKRTIKKNEPEKLPEQEQQSTTVAKVDFNTWFMIRKSLIPSHHHKEIIKADFMARKVPDIGTMDEFDAALEKYGLKLN